MQTLKHFIVMLMIVLLVVPAVPAQDAPRNDQTPAQDVQIVIQQQRVRFTTPQPVEQMHLLVTDQAGAVVFDSGAASVLEINWQLQDANGAPLKSGLYAYTLTLKEAGAKEARVRRGHFIVDRAQDRDGNSDKLWVTSQKDNGLGAELTLARNDDETVAGLKVTTERKPTDDDKAKLDGADKKNEKTKDSKKSEKQAAEVAGNGVAGQLAKFVSDEEIGNSEITEVTTDVGNLVGVGTPSPVTKLDVRGHLTLDPGGSPVLYTSADAGED